MFSPIVLIPKQPEIAYCTTDKDPTTFNIDLHYILDDFQNNTGV